MPRVRQLGARHAWLSITPEPERELPAAIAALRAGGAPRGRAVEAERARAERLVTHAAAGAPGAAISPKRRRSPGGRRPRPSWAPRALVLDVIHNHDNLKLGLPGEDST